MQPIQIQKTKRAFLEEVHEIAGGYFRRGEYFCSEAVVQTINDALGKPYPDEIVKMASSFPIGLGKAQCLCGAVSGGEMALGMVYGRTHGQTMDPKMFELAKALHDYTVKTYKATCCRIMTKKWAGDNFMSQGRKEHCIEITADIARWVAKAFCENGVFTFLEDEEGEVEALAPVEFKMAE